VQKMTRPRRSRAKSVQLRRPIRSSSDLDLCAKALSYCIEVLHAKASRYYLRYYVLRQLHRPMRSSSDFDNL
jgi:hypothetical protein